MKQKTWILLLLAAVPLLWAATSDRRQEGSTRHPVARYEFAQQSWVTGAGHAAAAPTLANVNGTLGRVDVIISSVTANPTVDVTLTGNNSVTLATFSTLADGTNHIKLSTSDATDFDTLLLNDTITATIDPSADAGGTAQTLTVDVILYTR